MPWHRRQAARFAATQILLISILMAEEETRQVQSLHKDHGYEVSRADLDTDTGSAGN